MFGIMHREELIEQAKEKLARQVPGRAIGVEKSQQTAPEGAEIVLASVQTVARAEGKRLARFRPEQFSKIWIDEVHHAPAKSYLTVLRHFGLHANPATPKLLVGTTATPERLDKLGYDELFDDVVFRYGLREGIADGWLADLACFRVATRVDLSKVRVRAGEFVESDLARAVDIAERNSLAVRVWRERAKGQRNLVFCVTKEHARHVAGLFERAGAKAACVVEDTPPEERRRAVQAFRDGGLEVLVNVTVLTEGFDVPEVGAVHLLRPTRSTALLLQMVGRGTRKAPGKERCLVFDYADDFEGKDLATIGKVFGLAPRFDFAGGSVLQQVEEIEQIARELDGLAIDDVGSLAALRATLQRLDPLKLYAAAAKEVERHGDFRWHRKGEDTYAVSWRNRTHSEVARGDHPYVAQERKVLQEKNLWGTSERLEVKVNQLGRWEVVLHVERAGRAQEPARLRVEEDLPGAIEMAEAWARNQRPHVVRLLDRTAEWNFHPATEAQIAALARKGYPRDALAGITKGDAAMLMQKPLPRFLQGQGTARAR
jgi:ATP-dependent helicase IRC3